jgi:hypothetical protein
MTLRDTRRSEEIVFTGSQNIDYQEEFSTTDLKENGVYEEHELDGLKSLCSFGTGLMGLNLVKKKKGLCTMSSFPLKL